MRWEKLRKKDIDKKGREVIDEWDGSMWSEVIEGIERKNKENEGDRREKNEEDKRKLGIMKRKMRIGERKLGKKGMKLGRSVGWKKKWNEMEGGLWIIKRSLGIGKGNMIGLGVKLGNKIELIKSIERNEMEIGNVEDGIGSKGKSDKGKRRKDGGKEIIDGLLEGRRKKEKGGWMVIRMFFGMRMRKIEGRI